MSQRTEATVARERDIIARRAAGETLESIGASYGVTRERVRQIIKKAGGPSSKQSHQAAAEARETAHQLQRDAFTAEYLPIARELASKGESLRSVVARLKTIEPSIDEVLASSVLRASRIVFRQDWSEDFITDHSLVAAVWFIFGVDYQIPPDTALAVATLDAATIHDVAAALAEQGVDEISRSRVLGVIAAARGFAGENPKVTLTGARYETLRRATLEEWEVNSSRGTHFWPPTRQTAMARFGGWNETLERVGLRKSKHGRSKGLVKYSAEDYHNASLDFVEWADGAGMSTSVDHYAEWRRGQAAAGHQRPAAASLRNVFGSWSQAIRSARESL
ncbi:hypothetical protein I6E52_09095 [Salinibacterium sp. NG253]|uniref:sigma factor-like helix-turn-helix DNA-binding protein n=1 Tax=Salinibacterium sp. NG253 TaxID=2792039 RepID=UPI0018CCBC6D|nr:sigma factor-like helix-turn-helix DNA-binding protein [Salinibacterium sp. NG253]MBH0117000.1 hypothetical protein [Salinibacterium sp. NG253]